MEDFLVTLVEKVSTLRYIVIFVAVVIGFGILYHLLTQCGHGIGQDNKALDEATVFTGIYFSIVTISSLGYGDMHPMGISKVLACLEVLFGLVIIGVMIAKVTSQRLSYQVERLFSSDAQKRLENFAKGFNKLQLDFAEIMQSFKAARFEEVVHAFQVQCTTFSAYFSDEASQGEYFRIVPAITIKQVGNAIDSIFFELKSIMDSQPKAEIRNWHIPEAIDAQRKVCRLAAQYADEDTRRVFQSIENTLTQLEGYFVPPEDLELDDSDEPQ